MLSCDISGVCFALASASPQPEPLLLGRFRFSPAALAGVVHGTRPALRDQGAGEVLTTTGRAHGHERDGAGPRLGAATQALAADPSGGVPRCGLVRNRRHRGGGGVRTPAVGAALSLATVCG